MAFYTSIKNTPLLVVTCFRFGLVVACYASGPVCAETSYSVIEQITNAPDSSWIKMNTNSFSDAWVPYALRPDDSSWANPGAVIGAWSSFAWDSNRGDLLLFGGGHANYAGNEVYRWRSSTQQWELASLPSALDSNYIPVGGAVYAPQSSHTYDNSVFLPLADRFVSFGGAAFQSGSYFVAENADGTFRRTGPYLFDPNKADPNLVGGADFTGVDPTTQGGYMWEDRDIYANLPNANQIGSVEGTTDYAFENGHEVIYISGPDGGGTEHALGRLTINDINDPSKDTFELLGMNWYGSGSNGAGAFDPINNLYIKTYTGTTPFTFWNLDTAGQYNPNVLVSLASAPANFNMNGQYGLEYDPLRGNFLLWGGGGEVFQLNVGNKDGTGWSVSELSTVAAMGGLPSADVGTGVLGKWHYAADLDVFVGLQDNNDGNVWFYKPTGWTGVGSVPLPGALPLMVSGIGLLLVSCRKKLKTV